MPRSKTVITVISKVQEPALNRSAALVVIYGDDLGKKYELVKPVTLIGRSSKSDIQIDQDSTSRSHASITCDARGVVVADLGSTNGTYVNDTQIRDDYVLRNGDLLRISRTIFKFLAGGNIEAAYHEEIYRLTTVDGLTQVFNRRYFEEALDREISRCRRYNRAMSLLLMDLDRFKRINDTYGHLAGDAVLKQTSRLLKANIRREDVLARYGGEEFALILPETEHDAAVRMAEKTRSLIAAEELTHGGRVFSVTISIGVATLSAAHDSAEALLASADERLYAAKSLGRNRVGHS